MPNAVAIPARNEEEHVLACLEALDGQIGARFDHAVLFANKRTDATAAVARALELHSDMLLHVFEETLPQHEANAGECPKSRRARTGR